MRRLLALLLCAFVLGACKSGEVRVPDDWRQYTGACTRLGKESRQRYTFWYPLEWDEYKGLLGNGASFDVTAREGDALVYTSCSAETASEYWGDQGATVEDALRESATSAELFCEDDTLEITASEQIEGPHGPLLLLAYNCQDSLLDHWSSALEVTAYSSPVVNISYIAEHDISERERELLLDVMRSVRFSE